MAKKINYTLAKKKLLLLLKESKTDFQDIDSHLVDRFIELHEIADLALIDIKKRGVVTAINAEGTVLQKNHSIGAYNDALKSILEISKKLGMSARDRADLGLVPQIDDDF